MDHPFLINKNFFYYLGLWATIAVAHFVVLVYLFSVGAFEAGVDSLIFNFLFAGFAFSYWYAIRYTNPEGGLTGFVILNHVIGAVVIVGTCVVIGNYLMAEVVNVPSSLIDTITPLKLFTGFFYYVMIVLVYYLAKSYHELQQKTIAENELVTIARESELNMLKFQINPHFIFNSLNSISSLTTSEPSKAREMVVKLSEFMRYSLKSTEDSMSTLREELNNVNLYLEIEKVRFGNKMMFVSDVSDDVFNMRIPNMVLQPLIENAIKYGVYEAVEASTIKLTASYDNDLLRIEISNSYEPESIVHKGRGIGLNNINNRLNLTFGRDDLMSIKKSDSIFTVNLKIPQSSE
ncbi:MAG: histidine kinase [Cyclobacteriaceae bacterium]